MSKIFDLEAKDIRDLDLKLAGKLPIDRDELLALVNSWGKIYSFHTFNKNNNSIYIKYSNPKEKYNLSKLDVSEISNFNSIFVHSCFNGDISSWDVSNATSMTYMFKGAINFNSPLDKWNTSNVISMYGMFYNTKKFNQNLNSWNVSKVKFMKSMFAYTKVFNQNLNSWNISNVIDINGMFTNAESFNQKVLWDISHIESCEDVFYKAKAFENRFNNGNFLPCRTIKIKEWLIENRDRMIAIDIKISKGKELNKFILDISLQNKSFIEKTFIKLKFYRKEYENRNI